MPDRYRVIRIYQDGSPAVTLYWSIYDSVTKRIFWQLRDERSARDSAAKLNKED